MIAWSDKKIDKFQKVLLSWFDKNGRNLPWRENKNPYNIWVSEIMLQQTRVETVVDYFNNFMKKFPDVESLANATENELLSVWEGLGYYSRVRNMQKAAQQIIQLGEWPNNKNDLQKLKGIGPYTAEAIASIAFNEVTPAIDGNAFRVYSRLFKITDDISNPKSRIVFYKVGQQIISKERPGDFNQAIMDIGSSYMSAKNFNIDENPIREFDQASIDGQTELFPVKKKKTKIITQHIFAFALQNGNNLFIQKRNVDELLSKFEMFPLFVEQEISSESVISKASEVLKSNFGVKNKEIIDIQQMNIVPIRHLFTHRKWEIVVIQVSLKDKNVSINSGRWVSKQKLNTLPKNKVQQKIEKVLFDQ